MRKNRMFSFALIAAFFAQLVFIACDKNEPLEGGLLPKDEIADCHPAIITSIEMADDMYAGQPFMVEIEFMLPTPCDNFQGVQLQQSRTTLNLDVCIQLSSAICITVIEMAHEKVILTLPSAGTYTLWYNGLDGEESISFVVKP